MWMVMVPQLETLPSAKSLSWALGDWEDRVSARKFEKQGRSFVLKIELR